MSSNNDKTIEFHKDGVNVVITAWGPHAVRVQASPNPTVENPESALTEEISTTDVQIKRDEKSKVSHMINGDIRVEVSAKSVLSFSHAKTGKVVFQEYCRNLANLMLPDASALRVESREFKPILGTDSHALTARFESIDPEERIYGMGQYQQANLNLKGSDIELAQRNSQASVPFLISSLGYGLLWNNPAIGRAVFGRNITTFEARSTKVLDYWIVIGETPKEILRAYTAVTGRPPMMPEYGLGFWQSRLRYQTQEEILDVAREHKKRGLPMDVIVCDYFHWPHQGDFKFDLKYWPDPAKMTAELRSMGIELMVSIWATVEKGSENWDKMLEDSLVIRQDRGLPMHKESPAGYRALFIDPTNPKTRSFVWDAVKRNYKDLGVDLFWLDVAEPQFTAMDFDLYRLHRGSYLSIGNAYPNYYTKLFYDGITESNSAVSKRDAPLNLVRCAWAGGQKYGLLLWSGDVASSWLSMRWQFAAGLNASLAGMAWWTADIGGFHGGDIHDPAFHELFIRWFQWGTFLPVMRLHGDREPQQGTGEGGAAGCGCGAANEVWTYGDEVYGVCKTYMFLREKMRPYIRGLMQAAHEHGDAVIRPMFYEFPEDEECWKLEDQYMFGDRYLVAPVFAPGVKERKVYLPKGAKWRQLTADGDAMEGSASEGKEGQSISVKCPLEYMPVFEKIA